tara:strand:- start:1612 stop:2499 length:888 start_codon:yes stop_codon:yes gene_type:complete
MDSKQILAVGSIAYDTIKTPHGNRDAMLGGSSTFFSIAASLFTKVSLIGVVGNDFQQESWQLFKKYNIDTSSIEKVKGKTFRWGGQYNSDYTNRETLFTELGVFEKFKPKINTQYKNPIIYLGNIQPELQFDVINKIKNPYLIAADTMNLWIDLFPNQVWKLVSKVNIFLINDEEARQLTGEHDLIKISKLFLNKGPQIVVIKKGGEGSLLADNNNIVHIGVSPNVKVIDPTGAGDSFAGGMIGYISNYGLSNTIKAVQYGTAIASYTVSGFGTEKIIDLNKSTLSSMTKNITYK